MSVLSKNEITIGRSHFLEEELVSSTTEIPSVPARISFLLVVVCVCVCVFWMTHTIYHDSGFLVRLYSHVGNFPQYTLVNGCTGIFKNLQKCATAFFALVSQPPQGHPRDCQTEHPELVDKFVVTT